MRVLARRAGLPAHAVYRHVHNRTELLSRDGRADHRDPHARTTPLPRDPRRQLERLAGDEWTMYRRHPWLLAILATDRPPTGPAVLAMVDRVVAAFTSAGYDPAEAFRAYLALSGYVQGMALLIRRDPEDTTYHAWWAATVARLERTGRTRGRPWLARPGRPDPTPTWTPGSGSAWAGCSTACCTAPLGRVAGVPRLVRSPQTMWKPHAG